MRRRVVVMTVSAVAVCGVVGALVVGPALLRGEEEGAAVTATHPDPVLVPGTGPVCGVPDLTQVVDDGVDHAASGGVSTVVEDVRPQTGGVLTARVSGGSAYVLSRVEATYTVARYALDDGAPQGETVVELAWDGTSETFGTDSFEVGADGSVYLLDTLMGRRDLIKVSPDGDESWRVALPEGPQSTGSVVDLYGTFVWDDAEHGEVVGVIDAAAVMHRVSSDGTTLEPLEIDGTRVGQLDDGAAVLVAEGPGEGDRVDRDLTVVDADGDVRERLGSWAPAEPELGVPSLPWTGASGVASAPGGGLLLAEPGTGLRWYGTDGVRKGTWPDVSVEVEQAFTLADGTPVLHEGDVYYLLTTGPEGQTSLTSVTTDRMAAELRAPGCSSTARTGCSPRTRSRGWSRRSTTRGARTPTSTGCATRCGATRGFRTRWSATRSWSTCPRTAGRSTSSCRRPDRGCTRSTPRWSVRTASPSRGRACATR